jgi:hypothetical protein
VFDDNGSFLLALFEFFLFFAWFMCLFWVFGDLFRSRDLSGWAKTLWALFLIVLPVLGMLVYVIVRGSSMQDRARDAAIESQQRQEAYIRSVATPADTQRSPAEEISKAKSLLDSGAITEAEFERLKSDALGRGSAAVA